MFSHVTLCWDFFSFSPTLFSLLSMSPWESGGLPSLSIAQGMVCIVTPGELFCLPGPLLLHADSTTSVPIANSIFLLEARKEYVVRWLQVSEQVFVDGCPFDNCYLWCVAVRKLNLISRAESFPALNSSWGSYFTLAFPFASVHNLMHLIHKLMVIFFSQPCWWNLNYTSV